MSSALQWSSWFSTGWAPGAMAEEATSWAMEKSEKQKSENKAVMLRRGWGGKLFIFLHQELCQPWVFICQPGGVSSVQARKWAAPFIHSEQQTPKRGGEPGGHTHGGFPGKSGV